MTTYAPLAIAIVLFITVTRILFPDVFRSTPTIVKKKVDLRYPSDEMVASAQIMTAGYAKEVANSVPPQMDPGVKRELMAMMYMIRESASKGEYTVSPGIDDPYQQMVVKELQKLGYKVEYQGFTYLISWE